MGDKFLPQIAVPEDSSNELKKAADDTNKHLLNLVRRTVKADPGFALARIIVLMVLALVATGSTVALILAALNEDGWAAAASATGMIVSLSIVGLLNPLQTIERDIIIRRWSDIIISGWAADLAEAKVTTGTATQRATDRYAVLAAAYSTMTSKTIDALSALVAATEAGEGSDAEDPETLAVTPIASQASAQGADIGEGVTIEAMGGSGKYTYAATGLPGGLSVTDAAAGVITGTVAQDAEARDWVVEITVTETLKSDATETPQSVSVKFVWTITAPDG